MNTNAVNVAVVDGKTITESVELRTTQKGEPVRIKAVKDGKYILAEGAEKPVAPENLTIKRVGNDLHVATEGTDPDQPQLIIEGFYESHGQLVGVAEDGAYYEYISSDAEDDHAAAFLSDGVSSPQVLGSEELVGFGNGLVAGSGVGWFWPALLGLGALGLLGAAYKLTRDDDKNSDGGTAVTPGTPGIGGATDNVGAVQGPIDKGGSTDDRTPTFTGGGTPGNTIIIEDNGKPIGEVVVGEDGKWEFTPGTPLPEGEHSIIVVEKDKDGNVSNPSDEFDFIIDITAPGKAAIDSISDDVGDQQGVIAPNGVTDDNTPTLSGTGEAGAKLEIFADGEKIGETTVNLDGTWTFTPPTALADGEYSFTTIATDTAGNVGLPSDPYIITIDTIAPVKPGIGTGGIEEAIDNVGPIIGDIGNGGSTDDGTPTFGGGGLTPGDKVTIIDDGVIIGDVIVGDDGRWEFTPDPALDEGPHPITVIVTDPAGNESEPSDPYIVIVDTTAPVKPGIGTGGIEEAIDNVGPIIGDIGNGGSTDDGTPTFGGGGLTPGDKVTIIDDGVIIGDVIVGDDGRWEFTPNPALEEGPHPITVIVTDPAGNESEPSDPYIVIVDTTAPGKPGDGTGGIEEAIDNVGPITGDIGNGGTTDDGTPTIGGGGLTPGDKVTIIDDGVIIGDVIVGDDGRWEFTPDPALEDGAHPITVIITDPVGNESEPSDPYIIIVDTQAPVAPTIDAVFDDQGTSTGNITPGDITDDAQPDISGQAEPGTTVIIYDNGLEIGRAPVGADGRWTYTPVPPLANGPHDLSAKAEDAAGNISDPSNSVDFELVAGGTPPAPSITGVFDDIADQVGNIMPGESTNDTEPQVSGTAEPLSTVTLFANGVAVGSVVADALGNWSITPNPALTPGLNNLTATATNSGGNVSPPTGNYPITVDTTAPAAADASELEDNVGAIVGPIASGDTTDDNTPTFSGTAEPNTTLIIFDNGVEIGRVPVDGAGNWSFTPAPALVDGPHSFSSIVVDAAGNRSPESTPVDFTVDTSAVVISIEQALDNVGPIQDPLASGSVTDDATPTLRGQATPGATVNIYLDGVLMQADVPVNAQGRWEYTVAPALPEGSYAFTATVVTLGGGESAPTADFNLEIDLTPSAAPTIDEVRDDVGSIQDPLADGATTDDTTPTLVGSGVAGDTIIIRNNGAEIGRVPVAADGSWSFTPNPPLNNGSTNEFDVIAQDPAGNQSAPSASWTVIIDTTPPVTMITSVVNDDGTPMPINPGDTTTDNTPFISGTSEPGSTVTIFDNGVAIGTAETDEFGNWEFPVTTPLGSGGHSLTASSVDTAGNEGPISNSFGFRIESAFGSIAGIEDFDDLPLNFEFEANVTVDRELMAITSNQSLFMNSGGVAGFSPKLHVSNVSSVTELVINFDFKGQTSSVVTMDLSTAPATGVDSQIRFYDASGTVIHTHVILTGPTAPQLVGDMLQIVMPNGLEAAGFDLVIPPRPISNGHMNLDNITLSDSVFPFEDFGDLARNFDFGLNNVIDREMFTIEKTAGVRAYIQDYVSGAGKFLALQGLTTLDFDLKGQAASTLGFELVSSLGVPGDAAVVRFYDAGGNLIHTHAISGDASGHMQISMPDGLSFSSFQIEGQNTNNVLLIKQIILADVVLPGSSSEVDSTLAAEQVIYVNEGDEAAVLAEGSDAIDTLVLTGANQVLDLSALTAQVSSIEVIDITGTGDNTLNLSLSDVLSQGGDSLFTADEATQMMVKGNAGDVVNLDDLMADGTDPGDWAGMGQVTVEGVTYNVFQHSSLDAQLLVQDGVTTNLV